MVAAKELIECNESNVTIHELCDGESQTAYAIHVDPRNGYLQKVWGAILCALCALLRLILLHKRSDPPPPEGAVTRRLPHRRTVHRRTAAPARPNRTELE